MMAANPSDAFLRATCAAMQVEAAGIVLGSGEEWHVSAVPPTAEKRDMLPAIAQRIRRKVAGLRMSQGLWIEDCAAEAPELSMVDCAAAAAQSIVLPTEGGAILWVAAQQRRTWSALDRELLARLAVSVRMTPLREPPEPRHYAPSAEARLDDAWFRILFDTSSVGILVGDIHTERFETNPAFKRFFWWFQGSVYEEAVACSHPDDLTADLRLLDELLSGKRDQYTIEKRYFRPDRSIVWANVTVTLVRDAGNAPKWLFTFVEDLTETKRREEELRAAHKMEALGRMAGGIAHEFNNLLTTIQGNVSLLRLCVPDETETAECIAEIQGSVRRSVEITRQLAAFTSTQYVTLVECDLSAVVRGCDALLKAVIHEHPLSLRLQLADNLRPVRTDRQRLEEALLNLVANARDAMPRGGTVTVETRQLDAAEALRYGCKVTAPHVLLAVRDTGTGIPPEILPFVFDPFMTTREVGQGTGLGLSIVYGVVTQAHGHVHLASEVDQGTTVTLLFPASLEH